MRRRRAVLLVMMRELRERSRAPGFRMATVAMLAIAVAAGVVPSYLDDDKVPQVDVAVVGQRPDAIAPALRASAAGGVGEVRVWEQGSLAEAEAALEDGAVDVVVDGTAGVVVRGEGTSERNLAFAGRLAAAIPVRAALAEAGVPEERVDDVLAQPPLPVRTLHAPAAEQTTAHDAVRLGGLVLMMALMSYCSWVASGVLEEKSSRMVEVVLAAVRPADLMAGKILGIGLLGLAQLVVVGGVGLLAAGLAGVEPPSAAAGSVALVALWFALGYAFYSGAFAALGAAASRQEDVQSTTAPVAVLLVVGYVLSIGVQADPDGTVARIGSFLPPLAPLTAPARVLLGRPPLWEVVLSVVLIVTATYGVFRLATRVYGGAALRFGAKMSLREVLRSAVPGRG